MSSELEVRDLFAQRRHEVSNFLRAALQAEAAGAGWRWRGRPDLNVARRVSERFPEAWWGVVVYSCFMSEIGAMFVAPHFLRPLDFAEAEQLLRPMGLPYGAVQQHRIQSSGHTGAKTALVSACRYAKGFRKILLGSGSFHERYNALGELHAPQWGRTTRFDLVLRASAIGLGSNFYEPDRAYLGESTGPRKGFRAIFGIEVTSENAARCEALLRHWSASWDAVAQEAGVQWTGKPFAPGDFENALCIYQERS
jgi:hypothetical protein